MKLLGVIGLLLTGLALGSYFSNRIKQKIAICDDLIKLCDQLSVDMRYKQSSIIPFVLSYIDGTSIGFISKENFYSNTPTASILTIKENEQIGDFIYSLGKTDSKSQISIIEAFRQYMDSIKRGYCDAYNSKSKVYITFGICGGLMLSLLLI
ncbi:MAG: hypothetical protein ACI4IN_04195 [Eubacterium sp.]